jgi:hypothetical protein
LLAGDAGIYVSKGTPALFLFLSSSSLQASVISSELTRSDSSLTLTPPALLSRFLAGLFFLKD